ncbi:hypothetical protein HBI25_184440 [Parastagonospora nodorum]|nr:hypothetical protein HBI25_184440 [Parastagonospora nodorum]
MESLSRSSPRFARRVTACQRCRRRKQKCDLKHPNCSNCEKAGASCLVYDSGRQTELPRDYVSNLEKQIEALRRENQALRQQSQPLSVIDDNPASFGSPSTSVQEIDSTSTEGYPASPHHQSHLQDLVKSVRSVVVEPSRQPRFLGPSSGITLATMVMASIRVDTLPHPPHSIHEDNASLPVAASTSSKESSLPPRHAADHLIEVYFQYRTPHMPFIQRTQVEKAVMSAYAASGEVQSLGSATGQYMFTAYMVFAIALCNIPNPSGGTSRVMQSEGCFRSAVGWVERVITYSKSDLETLRAVLLLAQFVSMCPWQGSLWHLTGIAMRLCVDMGLHWESEGQSLEADQDALYERRRLWHCAYHFDRVLSITLGRPFGITDESTRVPLPSPWTVSRRSFGAETNDFDVHHQRAHNHLFSLSKLESEIKHVQQSQTWPVKAAYPKPNVVAWMNDVQPRLQEWHSTIPPLEKAHSSSIFAHQAYWDVIYNNAILLLYRPSSSNQHSLAKSLSTSHNAACNLITGIKALQREGKLDVLWKSVHDLFMAGLTIIYSVWQSKEMRDRNHIRNSISALQSCASTLSAMSETFHGAAGCRDVFDALSSATIEWLITNEAEESRQTRVEFERQVEELLQQLQPSTTAFVDDPNARVMSNMLSTDNFAFGEMLNSAAQWPGAGGMGYFEMAQDQDQYMTGLGTNLDPFLY